MATLFWLKKRLWKKGESQDIENFRDGGEARKFYHKVKSKGYGPGIPTCKDEGGNLVTYIQSVPQYGGNTFILCSFPKAGDSDDWNLSVLCPVLKKDDQSVSTNYCGISISPMTYKILSIV